MDDSSCGSYTPRRSAVSGSLRALHVWTALPGAYTPGREGCLMTMMRKDYALQADAFCQTSHRACFFASRSHTAALQMLRESLKAGEALALLLGEPGVGKTFLVHAALAHRDLQHRS